MRTKKNPTPSPAKTIGAGLRAARPEGRPSRVYPPSAPSKTAKTAKTAGKSVPGNLAAFGGDGPLEERVSRLEGLFAYLGEGILRSLPDRLTTDALIEILGDRDDVASRRAADALFEAKR